MLYLFALLFSFSAHADFIWDELPSALPSHENFVKASKSGLSVLWWNTQMGELNLDIYQTHKFYPLDKNLLEMTESQYLPDLVILGEFNEKGFATRTLIELNRKFPFSEIVINNQLSKKHIAVFSKYPIQIKSEPLLWYKNEKQKKEFERQYTGFKLFDRQYIELTVTKNERVYNLVPVHMLNQWAELLAYYVKKLGVKLGKIRLGEEMVGGLSNPLMEAIRDLKKKIATKLSVHKLVLLGDFNCPTVIYDLPTACHGSLVQNMVDSMKTTQPSFPAASSSSYGKFPLVKIDQAVHSENLVMKYPRVLPLLGSDHYPVLFIIKSN